MRCERGMAQGSQNEENAASTPQEEATDPKEVARTMLLGGAEVDEIVQKTGLSRNVIGGMKGRLAASKEIPTKKELQVKARAGVEDRGRGEDLPFRRGKSAPELIVEICDKYGVKERATSIIADRCKRVPGGILHPSDFERLLMDLDSGLKRREAMLIAEEYDLALQGERREDEEVRRGFYPDRRGEEVRGRHGYDDRAREEWPYGYDELGRRRGSRLDEPYSTPPLSEGRLMEILERRERDLEDKMTRGRLEEKIGALGEDMSVIATELKNLKEKPPTVPQPSMEDNPYMKALELQLKTTQEALKENRDDAKEQAREWRDLIKEERKEHRGEVEKLEKDVEETKKSAGRGEGYKDDSLRLASEGMNRLADVVEKKQPLRIIIDGVERMAGEGEKPPTREKVGESGVASKVPKEYLA